VALQQGFATGEMGFNDKFALQKILNGPCPGSWLFSNSGRALALPATDVAVLGTSAFYGRGFWPIGYFPKRTSAR
jgi:hypothetical protein